MNNQTRLTEINQRKKELEAELSHIRAKIKRGIDGRDRQTLNTRLPQIIDELLELETEAGTIRLEIQLETELAIEQKAATAAVINPCLLVLLWDGKHCYYATRENVTEWQCEMIMELGQDAPVVLRVCSITPEMADKLPAWIWQTPDEREDANADEPFTTFEEDRQKAEAEQQFK